MADEYPEQPLCRSKSDYNALILEIMAKYDMSTPEGQELFREELASELAEHEEVTQKYMEGQAKTIHRYEVQHKNLVKENGKLRADNSDQAAEIKDLKCTARKVNKLEKQLAEVTKEKFSYMRLLDDFSRYIAESESGMKTNKRIKHLMEELKAKTLSASELQKKLDQMARDYAALERANEDMSDYADAKLDKQKKDFQRQLNLLLEEIEQLKEQLTLSRIENNALKAKVKDKDNQLDVAKKTKKVTHKTSSTPSSLNPNAIVDDLRPHSGKKPGAQDFHEHHPRPTFEATETILLDTPEEFLDTSRYTYAGTESKQLVSAHVVVEVTELRYEVFKDKKTGKKCHVQVPYGLTDEVTYDSSLKALLYILNNRCNVSFYKTKEFITQASHGAVSPSIGFICKLTKEFAAKTAAEREQILNNLMNAEHLNVDFTYGRLNKQKAVSLIVTDGNAVMYMARPKKGQVAVDGTFLNDYLGTIISDHENVLCGLGVSHQECMAHVRRYLLQDILFEDKLEWATMMLSWLTRSIAYWKGINKEGKEQNPAIVKQLKQEYDEIIELATQEYEQNPINPYYKNGYNLYQRMAADKQDYMLFLDDPSIPPTNNAAEILARKFKRKAAQVMTFRSYAGFAAFLNGMSIMENILASNGNLFDDVTEFFKRPMPPKPKKEEQPAAAENEQEQLAAASDKA